MLQLHFFFFLVFLFVFLKKESIFPLNPSQQLQFFFHQRIKVLLRACACTQFIPANLLPPLLSCADGLVSIYYHSCHFLHKWISVTQLQVATDWFCSWKYLLLSTSVTSQLTPKQHEPLRSCNTTRLGKHHVYSPAAQYLQELWLSNLVMVQWIWGYRTTGLPRAYLHTRWCCLTGPWWRSPPWSMCWCFLTVAHTSFCSPAASFFVTIQICQSEALEVSQLLYSLRTFGLNF